MCLGFSNFPGFLHHFVSVKTADANFECMFIPYSVRLYLKISLLSRADLQFCSFTACKYIVKKLICLCSLSAQSASSWPDNYYDVIVWGAFREFGWLNDSQAPCWLLPLSCWWLIWPIQNDAKKT